MLGIGDVAGHGDDGWTEAGDGVFERAASRASVTTLQPGIGERPDERPPQAS